MPVTFSEDGSITSISIYHGGGSGNALLGVYSDESGLPAAQMGVTSVTSVSGSAGWQTVNLISPVPVTAGQKVWLAWVFENAIPIRYTSGTPGRAISAEKWTGVLPITFGSSSVSGTKYSIFCNYTPGEVPEPTPTSVDLGNKEVYSSVSTGLSRKAMPVTFSQDGSITSISIYHDGGAGSVLLGVYSDAAGLPANKLGVTPVTLVSGSAGWQTVNLISPVPVTAGDKLWLAWVFENGISIRYTTGTPGRAISSEKWPGGLPASFGTSSTAGTKYSIYCTYVTDETPAPATVDLGYNSIYSTVSTGPSLKAMPVTFSEDGAINSISIYHNGGTGNVLLGVYNDQSGKPGILRGVTASTGISLTAGWQTVPLPSPVTVTAGQTVWLSFIFENSPGVRYTSGTPGRAMSSGTWADGMPATFGTSSISATKYSIYCTYTPAGTKSGYVVSDEFEPVVKMGDLKVYPNPFSEKLRFEFVSTESVNARIDLYDMTGRMVKTIFEQPIEAGVSYEAEFRPEAIISGMYIYRVTMGDNITNGKVVFKKE
jgi:hypothetical protein